MCGWSLSSLSSAGKLRLYVLCVFSLTGSLDANEQQCHVSDSRWLSGLFGEGWLNHGGSDRGGGVSDGRIERRGEPALERLE
jgi:hypothetical protein